MQNYPAKTNTWNFYEIPYYKLNKTILSVIGQWPERNTKYILIYQSFIGVLLLSMFIVLISKLITTPINMNLISNVVPMLLALITCTTKFYSHIYNKKEMKALLNHVKIDWQQIKSSKEIQIMQRYGKDARRYAITYALFMYACLSGFLFTTIANPILDIIAPLNESRPRQQAVEVEHFINPEKYFYLIYCHLSFIGVLTITILIATDTIFITYVQHTCGLFAIASIHLEYILCDKNENIHENKNLFDNDNSFRRKIAYCVEIHRKAIEVAEIIETSFTWPLLIQFLLNIVSISITLVKIVLSLNDLEELFKDIMFVIAQFIHVFVSSYPGQKLMDHSTYISMAAYNGKWYNMPAKLQKSLLFIIRRGMEPSLLTAGKMSVLSLTSFSMVIQTCMSYFTILCSLI